MSFLPYNATKATESWNSSFLFSFLSMHMRVSQILSRCSSKNLSTELLSLFFTLFFKKITYWVNLQTKNWSIRKRFRKIRKNKGNMYYWEKIPKFSGHLNLYWPHKRPGGSIWPNYLNTQILHYYWGGPVAVICRKTERLTSDL